MSLSEEIEKIVNQKLKDKVNTAWPNPDDADAQSILHMIKRWRNGHTFLRVLASIFSVGIVNFGFFLWALGKNKPGHKIFYDPNWVKYPYGHTRKAIEGINKIIKSTPDNNSSTTVAASQEINSADTEVESTENSNPSSTEDSKSDIQESESIHSSSSVVPSVKPENNSTEDSNKISKDKSIEQINVAKPKLDSIEVKKESTASLIKLHRTAGSTQGKTEKGERNLYFLSGKILKNGDFVACQKSIQPDGTEYYHMDILGRDCTDGRPMKPITSLFTSGGPKVAEWEPFLIDEKIYFMHRKSEECNLVYDITGKAILKFDTPISEKIVIPCAIELSKEFVKFTTIHVSDDYVRKVVREKTGGHWAIEQGKIFKTDAEVTITATTYNKAEDAIYIATSDNILHKINTTTMTVLYALEINHWNINDGEHITKISANDDGEHICLIIENNKALSFSPKVDIDLNKLDINTKSFECDAAVATLDIRFMDNTGWYYLFDCGVKYDYDLEKNEDDSQENSSSM